MMEDYNSMASLVRAPLAVYVVKHVLMCSNVF